MTQLTPDVRKDSPTPSRFTGRRVHFVGIGGCGMSGLARILIDAGAVVTGSEPKPNPQTFELTRRGVKISRDQMGELLDATVDLVVRTAAVPDDNREMTAAAAYGIPAVKYSELLGQVMAERLGIAVAGTHGKSTTTAMIAYAMIACGADPSFVVGGTVPQLGGGSRSGGGVAFVAEACEYDRSFHKLRPTVAIVTNIEEDHLDCYKDIGQIVESFRTFVGLVPDGGLILGNGQDPRVIEAVDGAKANVEWVGLSRHASPSPGTPGEGRGEGDSTGTILGEGGPTVDRNHPHPSPLPEYRERGPEPNDLTWSTHPMGLRDGWPTGDVSYNGRMIGTLKLSVAGEHNLFNATMAVAACAAAGIDPGKAIEALSGFTGVDRRMTEMGTFNGATVVDDYGHHPTEIRATLSAIRQRYNPKRLFCVFQPHQHSRTRFLLEDFATSFSAADETIVPDIYFVRDSEAERQSVSSGDLVRRITAAGQSAIHLPGFDAIVGYLATRVGPGDLVVTMGAGNVWEIGRDLVEREREQG